MTPLTFSEQYRRAQMDFPCNGGIPLRVIIVGAGIAGFSAAIALQRAGHSVRLIEKSSFSREAGFGISIAPNASKVLNSFGFDFSKARAVPCEGIIIYKGNTLDNEETFMFRKHYQHWGDRWYLIYRPDIHNELKRIAMSENRGLPLPELILGSKVVAVDIEKGSVTLESGVIHKADLIIGADGERSVVREAVTDTSGEFNPAPLYSFRNIISLDDILADPVTRKLYEERKRIFTMFTEETGTHGVFWLELRDRTLQDFGCWYLNANADGTPKVTEETNLREAMLKEFEDFHPDVLRLLKKSKKVTNWPLNAAEPHSNWAKSKAVVIGDAAHSMYPTTGQGGCQAIEDAGSLGVFLSGLTSVSEVPARLKLFEKMRRQRACTIQAMSSTITGREGSVPEDSYKYLPGETPFESAEAYQNYANTHDVIAESRRVLEEAGGESKLMAKL